MPAFFIRADAVQDDRIVLTGDLCHHLTASLRIKQGETVLLTDDQQRRYRTSVEQITKASLSVRILERTEGPPQAGPSLILAQAILKGDHMDWVIQKAGELGVHSILPLITRHGVVRPREDRVASQLARWQRIATEAAQQSEQWRLPLILEPVEAASFFAAPPTPHVLVLLERQHGARLWDVPLTAGVDDSVAVAVGPEGGWAEEEIDSARRHGRQSITLGEQILRAETAAVAAVSVLQCRVGRLG